jgi:O-acetyl-ADP-ribose deacetylase (regulator of RNase III)
MAEPVLTVSRPDGTTARLTLARGDITVVEAEAIVNAANSALAGGGGVDGAIHRAAGPELMTELRARYRRCPTGSAVITGPGRLAGHGVRHIIHAVGPIWQRGRAGEAELLASAYRASMRLAREAGDRRVAFPAISCGIYGYPLDEGASIALRTVAEELRLPGSPEEAVFVLFSTDTADAFRWALESMAAAGA